MNALAQSTKQNKNASTTNTSSLLVQRKCACGGVSRLGGQCSECEKKKLVGGNVPLIQPKLKIGQSNDKYEQESDRVAEQVMALKKNINSTPPQIQRLTGQATGGVDTTYGLLQRKSASRNHVSASEKYEQSSKGNQNSMPENSDRTAAENRTGLPDSLKGGLESLSGFDLSGVRVHRNSVKPSQVNALAYTQGQDIYLGSGQERHLPHEGWHAVQQMQGRVKKTMQAKGVAINEDMGLEREADTLGAKAIQAKGIEKVVSRSAPSLPIIQLRRLPSIPDTLDLVEGKNDDAHGDGLIRLVNRTFGSLNSEQQEEVRNKARGTLTGDKFKDKFPQKRVRYILYANAIRRVFPKLILGDPSLMEVGARSGTDDFTNITALVTNANKIFDEIATGNHDSSIKQIFGRNNVERVRNSYKKARKRMNQLKQRNKIASDRSGFSSEVLVAGSANSSIIILSPKIIDAPDDKKSIITMIHEAIHAGNSTIDDNEGYISKENFSLSSVAAKLTTAAYYEVVPRRILGTKFAFVGKTFTPAGTTNSTGASVPPLTSTEKAFKATRTLFRKAWDTALNLHGFFVSSFRNPTNWNTNRARNTSFANSLPFWSKVEMLTVHLKTKIDPAEGPASKGPV